MTDRQTTPRGTTMTRIRRTSLGPGLAAAALGALALAASAAAPATVEAQPATPEIAESTISVGSGAASLELELADGATHTIEFRDGRVLLDGEELGSYEPGGALERSWRDLLADAMREAPAFEMTAEGLRGWDPPADGPSAGAAAELTDRLDGILRAEPSDRAEDTVSMEGPGGDAVSLAPGRLSFERLAERLGRLQGALDRLGSEAREAGEEVALVVHDDYEIVEGRSVDGNLALLGGDLALRGTVRGDVLVLDGTLTLGPTARVDGDVLQVGGDVRRQGGTVTGELLSVQALDGEAAPPAPAEAGDGRDFEDRVEERVRERVRELRDRGEPGFFGGIVRNVGRAVGGVVGWIGVFLMLGLAGVLAVYFVRPRLEVVADTARHAFGRSFGVGLAGGFLFFPVLLILVVAVITWLVIPFYLVAAALGLLGGLLAVGHAAGEMLARRRFRYEWMERLRRSNSYYYVLSGLAALLLPFALAEALHLFGSWLDPLRGFILFVAITLLSVAVTTGFGAVLLSRGGERSEYAKPAGEATATEPDGGVR